MMENNFDSFVFIEWGEQLSNTIREVAKLIYDKEEIKEATENEDFVDPTDIGIRLEVSNMIINVILDATRIKISRHKGQIKAIGYLLFTILFFEELINSPSDEDEKTPSTDYSEAKKQAVKRCEDTMENLELKLSQMISELTHQQVQIIHDYLIEDVDVWSEKAIEIFTVAQLAANGE